MKKNYFLTLLLTLCFSAFSFGQATDLFISMYAEGSSNHKFIEIYNGTGASVDLSKYMLKGSNNGGDWKAERDVALTGTLASGDVYVVSTDQADASILAQADLQLPYESPVHYNGDDAVGLFKDNGSGTFVLLDVVGVPTVDPGTAWEVAGVANATQNHTLTRKITVCSPNTDWAASAGTDASNSEWVVTNVDTEWANLGSFTGCSSSPSLKIDSPTEGSTIDFTANPVVKFTVTNFNVAASGGDGFIKWKLDDVAQTDKTDTSDITFAATAGTAYKVYIELVDNSGNPLGTPVNATVNFTVNHPCDLVLADISTMCDALTTGADTFNGSIDFTGGNTGVTYTITAKDSNDNNVGTIGGDNPSSATSGKITVTGIPEGMDITVKIVGDATSSCDYSRTLFSPTCVPFPVVETFDYTADSDLTASANWQTSSSSTDKVKVVTGTIGNPFSAAQFPNPTGNMVSFDGGGADPYIEFNQQNTGIVYTSFIFTATDISGLTKTEGGYFAVLTQASGSYRGRLWLRQDATDNTKYNVGVSATFNGTVYHTTMHTPGEEIFIVMGYDFTSNEVKVWIDPDPATFSATIPTETIKVTATGGDIPTDLGRFLLRQDSGSETPSINFDELRISTNWTDVTPKGSTASVGENPIDGFAAYPNPVRNGKLMITSATSDVKNVSIYNVLGRKVFTETISGTSKQLNISSIKSGIYILKVVEGTKSSTKKLVVR